MVDKFVYDTGIKGANILILGAVHGNEVSGTNALFELKEKLDNKEVVLKSGCLTIIPVANPLAFEQKVRFVEKNLNRIIGVYDNPQCVEEEFASEIAREILKNEYVLDLHSTHNQGEEPFVFLDYPTAENKKMVDAVDVSFVVTNWPDIYENSGMADMSTEKFSYINNVNAITVECGYHNDVNSLEIAKNTIYNVLIKLDMLQGLVFQRNKQYVKMKTNVVKIKEGYLTKSYKHLDNVFKGDVLAVYEDGTKIEAKEDGFILIPNHDATIDLEWFYLAS
ncbi:MAG: succinylglutamate desuccinylase/aspartoacylase family protein [Alphaproteobacteria bacterium]